MAEDLHADALIVFTRKGKNARNISWLRPLKTPIYAFTDCEYLCNQLTINWGTLPFCIDFSETDPAENVVSALDVLKAKGLVESGCTVVIVTEIRTRGELVNTIQMAHV